MTAKVYKEWKGSVGQQCGKSDQDHTGFGDMRGEAEAGCSTVTVCDLDFTVEIFGSQR